KGLNGTAAPVPVSVSTDGAECHEPSSEVINVGGRIPPPGRRIPPVGIPEGRVVGEAVYAPALWPAALSTKSLGKRQPDHQVDHGTGHAPVGEPDQRMSVEFELWRCLE